LGYQYEREECADGVVEDGSTDGSRDCIAPAPGEPDYTEQNREHRCAQHRIFEPATLAVGKFEFDLRRRKRPFPKVCLGCRDRYPCRQQREYSDDERRL
jgi:hypothetical protein